MEGLRNIVSVSVLGIWLIIAPLSFVDNHNGMAQKSDSKVNHKHQRMLQKMTKEQRDQFKQILK